MQQSTRCNPLVIHPSGDHEGRYEVWCRRCGSRYTDSWELAQQMTGDHKPADLTPPPVDTARAAAMHDWSESQSTRMALDV